MGIKALKPRLKHTIKKLFTFLHLDSKTTTIEFSSVETSVETITTEATTTTSTESTTTPTTTTLPPYPTAPYTCTADGSFPINRNDCTQEYYSCIAGGAYYLVSKINKK